MLGICSICEERLDPTLVPLHEPGSVGELEITLGGDVIVNARFNFEQLEEPCCQPTEEEDSKKHDHEGSGEDDLAVVMELSFSRERESEGDGTAEAAPPHDDLMTVGDSNFFSSIDEVDDGGEWEDVGKAGDEASED